MQTIIKLEEIVSSQNEIIKQQSDIIEELYTLLLQHITVEEADKISTFRNIKNVSEKIKTIM